MATALSETLKYLASVDSTEAAALHARVDSLLANIRLDYPDYRPPDAPPGYERLSEAERNALTAAIGDVIILMERRQAQYIAASTATDYEWAYRAAIGARQMDSWLRQTPLGWQPSSKNAGFFSIATDVRDRAQADNLDWIIKQEGASGKILIYAHTYHLSAAPVTAKGCLPEGTDKCQRAVAGTYLRQRFGHRFLNIGNLIAKGEVGCGDEFRETLNQAPAESIAGLLREIGAPRLLIDVRTAPPPVKRWLDKQHALGQGLELPVGRAFDVLFYLDAVTPTCGAAVSIN